MQKTTPILLTYGDYTNITYIKTVLVKEGMIYSLYSENANSSIVLEKEPNEKAVLLDTFLPKENKEFIISNKEKLYLYKINYTENKTPKEFIGIFVEQKDEKHVFAVDFSVEEDLEELQYFKKITVLKECMVGVVYLQFTNT